MATVNDLVRRALVLATVIADDETPTAPQMADAIDDLNDMLAAWRIEGLQCGGPYVANDELAVPDAFMRALRLNLAVELAPSYGVSAANVMMGRRSLAAMADESKAMALGASMDVPDAVFDPGQTQWQRGADWGFRWRWGGRGG